MAESVSISTPEQVAFSVELADLGSRFLAIALDSVIQVVVLGAIGLVLGVLFFAVTVGDLSARATSTIGSVLLGIALASLFFVFWGYHIGFETWMRGQSPGKRAFGIRVVKDSGAPESFLDAVIRNLVRVADMLPSTYAIGVLAICLTKDHKRLGDMAAGTLVVKEAFVHPVAPAPGLDPARSRLLTDFLARASELDPLVRDRLALELAARLGVEGADTPQQALDKLARLRAPARQVG